MGCATPVHSSIEALDLHWHKQAHHIQLAGGMPAEAPKPERPHQFYINEHWDHCLDLTLRRVVYGGLAAGLAGLVLFRAAPQYALCE